MTTEPTRTIHIRLLPYDDGSGHRVEVKAANAHYSCEPAITLITLDDSIYFPAAKWPEVRAAIDEAAAFLAKEPSRG